MDKVRDMGGQTLSPMNPKWQTVILSDQERVERWELGAALFSGGLKFRQSLFLGHFLGSEVTEKTLKIMDTPQRSAMSGACRLC